MTVIDSAEASLQELMRRRSSMMASLELTPPVARLITDQSLLLLLPCLDDEHVLAPHLLLQLNIRLIVCKLAQCNLPCLHTNLLGNQGC